MKMKPERQQQHKPQMPSHGKMAQPPMAKPDSRPHKTVAKPYTGMKDSAGVNDAMGGAGAITGLRRTGGY